MEPLPPVKEVEYRCYISKIFEELSGTEYMTFAFETAKEFSSFRYEIAVRYRISPGKLEFKVLGMTATRTMMPAFGTARSVLKVPLLPLGVYEVRMIKSDGMENIFSIEVTKKGFQLLLPIPRKRFIDLVIESHAAMPNGKHLSTVSKAPPMPLVPRTIQKRQLPPPTPEEQAILDSLRTETPEERDLREEAELFGTSSKSSAKRAIEEVKEVPVPPKPKSEAKAKEPAAAKAKEPAAKAKEPAAKTKEPAAKAKKPEAKPAKKVTKPAKKVEHKAKPASKKPAAKKPAPKPKPKAKPAPKKSGKKK